MEGSCIDYQKEQWISKLKDNIKQFLHSIYSLFSLLGHNLCLWVTSGFLSSQPSVRLRSHREYSTSQMPLLQETDCISRVSSPPTPSYSGASFMTSILKCLTRQRTKTYGYILALLLIDIGI